MFIPIGAGVLKASKPNSLLELEGNVIMTEMWRRFVLKSMNWVKREELPVNWNHRNNF